MLVKVHGGPTSAASSTLNLGIQYWTSRGIAVLDVNYGGSTGFGRAYRDRLHLTWGVVDVDDCVNGAKFLAEQGRVDGKRCVISGGSAGGYTTLAALTFRDFFQGGASYYGVSDAAALARDTHKFESRYLDWLIGPYPQEEARYRERSPLYHADRLSKPVIFFQGDEDAVVPPNQAEVMVEALRRKGNRGRLFSVRGRAARLSQGRQHPALPGRGALLLCHRGVPDGTDVLILQGGQNRLPYRRRGAPRLRDFAHASMLPYDADRVAPLTRGQTRASAVSSNQQYGRRVCRPYSAEHQYR